VPCAAPRRSPAVLQHNRGARDRLEHQHLPALDALGDGHSPLRVSSDTVRMSRKYTSTGSLSFSSVPGVRSSSTSAAVSWATGALAMYSSSDRFPPYPLPGRLHQWIRVRQFSNPIKIASHSDLRLGSLAASARVAHARLRHPYFLDRQIRFSANLLAAITAARLPDCWSIHRDARERLTPITTTWYLRHRRFGARPDPAFQCRKWRDGTRHRK